MSSTFIRSLSENSGAKVKEEDQVLSWQRWNRGVNCMTWLLKACLSWLFCWCTAA